MGYSQISTGTINSFTLINECLPCKAIYRFADYTQTTLYFHCQNERNYIHARIYNAYLPPLSTFTHAIEHAVTLYIYQASFFNEKQNSAIEEYKFLWFGL